MVNVPKKMLLIVCASIVIFSVILLLIFLLNKDLGVVENGGYEPPPIMDTVNFSLASARSESISITATDESIDIFLENCLKGDVYDIEFYEYYKFCRAIASRNLSGIYENENLGGAQRCKKLGVYGKGFGCGKHKHL